MRALEAVLTNGGNMNQRYRATYTDPIDGSVTHYWEFTDNNLRQAQKRAKDGILQRNDGYVDVLTKVELIGESK
jgi:hypothetical protein